MEAGWSISADLDATPEFVLHTKALADRSNSGQKEWYVERIGQLGALCSGTARNGGFDGEGRLRLAIRSECFARDGQLSDGVRVSGFTDGGRSGGDSTAYTALVPIS